MTPVELLTAYKAQPHLERRHATFKGVIEAAPIMLKSEYRVDAFGFCLYVALLLHGRPRRPWPLTRRTCARRDDRVPEHAVSTDHVRGVTLRASQRLRTRAGGTWDTPAVHPPVVQPLLPRTPSSPYYDDEEQGTIQTPSWPPFRPSRWSRFRLTLTPPDPGGWKLFREAQAWSRVPSTV